MSTSKTKKTSYHHGNLEQTLLKVGLKEAKSNGSQNLGLTHLAKLVNVSPMAVYRHFDSGESLKAGISQKAREELARRMVAAVEKETDVKSRFLAIGRTYIEFGLAEPGLFSVAFIDCAEQPKTQDEPSCSQIFEDAILDLCNEGLIKTSDVQGVAAFAWSLVHGFAILAGGAEPKHLNATKVSVEELLQRAWTGISQFNS